MGLKNIIVRYADKVSKYKYRKQHKNAISEWPVQQMSTEMGVDRGTPIDRVYIEQFMKTNASLISGTVVEIGDNTYTMQYGDNIRESVVITQDENSSENGCTLLKADLQTGDGVKYGIADCFILTQTLPFIYDIKSVCNNVMKILKPGGAALVTVPGISAISVYDYSRWGHFWGMTDKTIVRLFEEAGATGVEAKMYGNAKIASAFLYGLCAEELTKKDFEYNDNVCPIVITALVRK